MLCEAAQLITEQEDGTPDGELRSRLCAAIFLIGKLPTTGGATIGLRATPPILADLLAADLQTESSSLRRRIPGLLDTLVETGTLTFDDDEYRLPLSEDTPWETGDCARDTTAASDIAKIAEERTSELRRMVAARLSGVSLAQDTRETSRGATGHVEAEAPPAPVVILSQRTPAAVRSSCRTRIAREPISWAQLVRQLSPPDPARGSANSGKARKRTMLGLALFAVATVGLAIVVGMLGIPGQRHAQTTPTSKESNGAMPTAVSSTLTVVPNTPTAVPNTPTAVSNTPTAVVSTPPPQPSAPTVGPATADLRVVAAPDDGLYLRPKPDAAVILTVIPDKAMVIVLGPTQPAAGQEWTYIRLASGEQGWVASAYLAPIPAVTATP